MKKRVFRDYQEKLMQDLQDPGSAEAYLNEAMMDEDPQIFLLALKDVLQAKGQEMTSLAKKAKLSRENLYRILSKKGNPELNSIISLLDVAGYSFSVHAHKNK
jgi:probable addiction module antidote protein